MKKFVIPITAALAFSSIAGAQRYLGSPAQDLFDQATFYLDTQYYGFSTVKLPELFNKSQLALDSACETEKDKCAYKTAYPVIGNMVKEIGDKHTNFLPPEDAAEFSQVFTPPAGPQAAPGPRIGVSSIRIPNSNDRRIVDVVAEGAAEEAGLLTGDRITALNGQELPTGKEENDAAILKVVETAQPFKLTIKRSKDGKADAETFEITLQGKTLSTTSGPLLRKTRTKDIALLRIPLEWRSQIGPQIHALIKRIQNANVAQSLIVDLRFNGGGVATECLSAAAAFVGNLARIRESRYQGRVKDGVEGNLVYRENTQGQRLQYYKIPDVAQWTGKTVVLVNRGSASCSEYFASDLQLTKKATIMGEQTVGVGNTGTVVFPLADKSGLQVSIVRSLRLDGSPYPESVKPDIATEDTKKDDKFYNFGSNVVSEQFINDGVDATLDKAIDFLQGKTTATLFSSFQAREKLVSNNGFEWLFPLKRQLQTQVNTWQKY